MNLQDRMKLLESRIIRLEAAMQEIAKGSNLCMNDMKWVDKEAERDG